MSNETFNISDYTWQSYQEGDKVMIRPVNRFDGTFKEFYKALEWQRDHDFARLHTYQSTGIEPGIEIEGDKLEGVWADQYSYFMRMEGCKRRGL